MRTTTGIEAAKARLRAQIPWLEGLIGDELDRPEPNLVVVMNYRAHLAAILAKLGPEVVDAEWVEVLPLPLPEGS